MMADDLYGEGLDAKKSKDDDDESDEDEHGDDDDAAELGAKYMQRLAGAMESGDWEKAYKVFCRLVSLHEVEDRMEQGY